MTMEAIKGKAFYITSGVNIITLILAAIYIGGNLSDLKAVQKQAEGNRQEIVQAQKDNVRQDMDIAVMKSQFEVIEKSLDKINDKLDKHTEQTAKMLKMEFDEASKK